MQKRGQVTIFMVVGIVFLFIFAGIFYLVSLAEKTSILTEAEDISSLIVKSPVISYVENCLGETAIMGIFLLAANGGIIYPDENSLLLLTDNGMINYASLNGVSGFSNKKMEADLSRFTEEYLEICLDDFTVFRRQGREVGWRPGEIYADFKINEHTIISELEFPLKISTSDGDEVELNKFSTKIQTNFKDMIKTAQEIVRLAEEDYLDLNWFVDLEYYPVIFLFDEATTIFSLTDEKNLLDDAPLTLMFAVRNDHPPNHPPTLDFIPDKVFKVGNKWEEFLIAEDPDNDDLIFGSDSNLFPVLDNGYVNTIIRVAGTYEVTFTVKDERGLEDKQEVKITVLPNRENE